MTDQSDDFDKASAIQYRDWQRELVLKLPDWANRVFALRGKAYRGAGLRYDLERQLGNAILIAHNHARYDFERAVLDEVIVEVFEETLVSAENSLT